MTTDNHLYIYVPHLGMGGGELSLMRLAEGLLRAGWRVSFVVHRAEARPAVLAPGIPVFALGVRRTLGAVWKLARLLRERRVSLLLSAFPHSNAAAVLARMLSGTACRVVLSEHAPLTQQVLRMGGWRYRLVPSLVRLCYPRADAVVGVSRGVCEDLRVRLGGRLEPHLIHNPVVPAELARLCEQPAPHPWLDDPSLAVVLSVSRLSVEKDIATLLRAFEKVARGDAAVRLLVVGEGPERAALQEQVRRLGLDDRVAFPGLTSNPFAWMSRSRVLVLASQFEGFGNVLVEALASGTQVVSADCPVGPREILDNGRLGALVPVGDDEAMAAAIVEAIRRRAARPGVREAVAGYTQDKACAGYMQLFQSLPARVR